MSSELEEIIPSLPVIPFPQFKYKPFRHMPVAYARCPKCQIVDNIFKSHSIFPISYCPGNRPAEIEHEVHNPFSGEKKTHKHQVMCAHISFEHFHCQCQVCDFFFAITMPEVK